MFRDNKYQWDILLETWIIIVLLGSNLSCKVIHFHRDWSEMKRYMRSVYLILGKFVVQAMTLENLVFNPMYPNSRSRLKGIAFDNAMRFMYYLHFVTSTVASPSFESQKVLFVLPQHFFIIYTGDIFRNYLGATCGTEGRFRYEKHVRLYHGIVTKAPSQYEYHFQVCHFHYTVTTTVRPVFLFWDRSQNYGEEW